MGRETGSIRRLTTIIMPHREKIAGLRPRSNLRTLPTEQIATNVASEFRTMSAIAALKYGVTKKYIVHQAGSIDC